MFCAYCFWCTVVSYMLEAMKALLIEALWEFILFAMVSSFYVAYFGDFLSALFDSS